MQYPGGKNGAGVFQTIINQIPPHRVYIEAFAGSAAIFRHKRPARTSYLIDIDPLVDLEQAAGLPMGARAPSVKQPRGSRNGGTAGRSWPHQISYRQTHRCGPEPVATTGRTADATGVICVHADARSMLAAYPWQGDEFVYLDPPYLVETRRAGRQRRIYRCELREAEEHLSLLSIIKTIPAAVMISGYPSKLYALELKGWRTLQFTASTRGGPADEVLWMNYQEPLALHDYRYLGLNFRQRQDFKRMRERWTRRLRSMPVLKRQALLAAIDGV